MQSCGTMCHSENKYGDKQNKNRWACKTVDIIRETDAVTNRIKTVGTLKLCIENTYNRKQNINHWSLQITL